MKETGLNLTTIKKTNILNDDDILIINKKQLSLVFDKGVIKFIDSLEKSQKKKYYLLMFENLKGCCNKSFIKNFISRLKI